jgi:hypothetical protein
MYVQIKNLLNTLTFWIRNKIALKRPIKSIYNQDKSDLFGKETALEEKKLIQTYHLQDLYDNSTITTYKENLYTVKLLEDSLSNQEIDWNKSELKVLDIGSKNFSYATGINNFFGYFNNIQNIKREIYLDGVEVDPYRIMIDLHSRYDYARYHIKKLGNTRYLTLDFLEFPQKGYDFITWFLPFIVKEPLIRWGIPMKYLKPVDMLTHAFSLLATGGIMLVVNQLETEKNIQLKIIRQLGLNYSVVEKPYNNNFSPYRLERHITLIKKE